MTTGPVIGAWLALLGAGLAGAAEPVRFEGASAGAPFARAAVAAYAQVQRSGSSVPVYAISGSTEALNKLCRGQLDLALVARAAQAPEQAGCGEVGASLLAVPVAYDAVTVVANARNPFLKVISVEELRNIWSAESQGRRVRWRQINPDWADAPLKLMAPDPRSGDAVFFNEAILGKGAESRRDVMTSAEDAVLVRGVARDVHALGFVSLAYLNGNRSRLRAVPVAARAGSAGVTPSPENVAKGLYKPLSRLLILHVNTRALAQADTAQFAEYLVANGARWARDTQYAALPDSTYREALGRLRAARGNAR